MMATILNHPGSLFAPAKADELAKQLNADSDDGWTYTVVHDPSGKGYSFIEIRDEEGVFVGKV